MKKLIAILCVCFLMLSGCSKKLSYEDITGDYLLSSGVGAWSTSLTVNEDGTFSGSFIDSDMGVTDTDYPDGTVYYCNFSGEFDDLEKVDDTTYKTTVKSLTINNRGTYIDDGIRYVESEAYGIANAQDIIIYTEDTKVEDLSEGAQYYVNVANEETSETLDCICIYNEAQDLLFVKQD